jgi:hypothetical protein
MLQKTSSGVNLTSGHKPAGDFCHLTGVMIINISEHFLKTTFCFFFYGLCIFLLFGRRKHWLRKMWNLFHEDGTILSVPLEESAKNSTFSNFSRIILNFEKI